MLASSMLATSVQAARNAIESYLIGQLRAALFDECGMTGAVSPSRSAKCWWTKFIATTNESEQ
jgi:hypothetical protein